MLISPAHAQGAAGGLGGLEPLIPLVLIFVVFYFLLIRPQQKKAKVHREMLGAIKRGDRIVTSGGMIGTVSKVVGDTELLLEVADQVKVRVLRAMVADVLTRSAPPDEDQDDEDKDKEKDKARRKAGSSGND